jgi:hypothetical protein
MDEINKEIVDQVSYDLYIDIEKQLSNMDSEYEDPFTKETISLLGNTSSLQKKLFHLDDDEQDRLLALSKAIKQLIAQRTHLKRKAYGVKKGQQANTDPIMQYRDKIVEYFGQFHSVDEVYKIIVSEWQLPCNKSTLQYIRTTDAAEIRQLQDNHQRDYTSVRLAHKKSRLLELAHLYESRKTIYDRTKTKDDYGLLLRTIEQIRKEVEGDKLFIEGSLDVNIQMTIENQLNENILKELSIIDIVLSRVAARTNVNPNFILTKLHQSIYSKFTGFSSATRQQMLEDEIFDIGGLTYDFDAIKKRIGDVQTSAQVKQQSAIETTLPLKQNMKAASISALLKAKIAESRARVDSASDGMLE